MSRDGSAETPDGPDSMWRRMDAAASGLLYGTIASLSVLMTMEAHPEHPLRMAAALFGTVLAITLAKAFAEVMAAALKTGRGAARPRLRESWRHASPTLIAANLPTALILAAGVGLLSLDRAIAWSQGFCVLLLILLGARVGWVVGGGALATGLGALYTGGIGLALATLKYVLH